ncbi:AAA family ATPase, partial [bacterium]
RFPALARRPQAPERERVASGSPGPSSPTLSQPGDGQPMVRIFPYGIARTRLERAIREKRAPAYVTNDLNEADAVMAIRSTVQAKPRRLRDLAGRPVNTVVVKSNTFSQIATALDDILRQATEGTQAEQAALDEASAAIEQVLASGKAFDLAPAPAPVRKAQHRLAEANRLASESVGEEPNRRLRLLPTRLAV